MYTIHVDDILVPNARTDYNSGLDRLPLFLIAAKITLVLPTLVGKSPLSEIDASLVGTPIIYNSATVWNFLKDSNETFQIRL